MIVYPTVRLLIAQQIAYEYITVMCCKMEENNFKPLVNERLCKTNPSQGF
jgi:hypothetical protein